MTSGRRSKKNRKNTNLPAARQAAQPAPPDNHPPDLPYQTEISATHSQLTVGPLPPPEMLSGYGHVHPSFPERIVAMAEQEQAHRQTLETKAMDSAASSVRRGQRGMIGLAAFGLVVAFAITLFADDSASAIFIGLASVVSAISAGFGRRRGRPPQEQDHPHPGDPRP